MLKNKLKFSIIIPIYNSSRYLDRCILSVINQTYKNLQIILVNNNSTDNSYEMCLEYQKRDNRIILLNEMKPGVSNARNLGIKYATGDYLGFVDSDDFIEFNMYEVLAKLIEKTSCDIAICGVRKTKKYEINKINKINNNFDYVTFNSEGFIKSVLEDKNIQGYSVNKLYKYEILTSDIADFVFDNNCRLLEDELFNINIGCVLKRIKCSYCNLKLYNYFLHSNSAVHSFKKSALDVFYVREKEIEILKNSNYLVDVDLVKLNYIMSFLKLIYLIKESDVDIEILNIKQKSCKYFKEINWKNVKSIKRKIKLYLLLKLPILYKLKIKFSNDNSIV